MSKLLQIENLSLVVNVKLHHSWTVRDLVVDFFRDPLKNLMRTPEKLIILDQIDLTVNSGDRLAILGVNGVGKTTFCRCIAGIYRPSKGKIVRHGQIRAIFETSVGVYPELTGRENAYILSHFLFPTDVGKHKEIVESALDFSELGAFLDSPFRTYSNGMKARLCLSLVTALPSDILILDEVFEGADQFWREKIAVRTMSVIESSGAVVFVSHSEEQIKRVCNRAVVLHQGKIRFDGSPADACQFYTEMKK